MSGSRTLKSRIAPILILPAIALCGCAGTAENGAESRKTAAAVTTSVASAGEATEATKAPKRSMGNGKQNWIVVEGATRNGNVLTFEEVNINGNGWLVMHPFEDGKPNGDKYVASTYVSDGKNRNVDIEVYKGVDTGEMFIVMLHRDVNENKIFDFVFVDDLNVMDTAVFEGSRMIGHAVPAP